MISTALKRLAICCSAVTLLILCSASPARVGELRTDRYVYTGGIDHGKQHGFGICRYTNGNVYSGHWNHAYKEGLGLMEFADGTMEFGRWRRGTLQRKSGTNFNVGQTVYGLDVSKYQKNIKWKQLALPASARGKLTKTGTYLQPVLFMVVKSTQGTSLRNEYFERQFHGARDHGIIRGAYHFLSPSGSGRSQARYFIQNTPLEKCDMPPVLDLEINRNVMLRDHSRIVAIAKEWLEEVESYYGVKPIIYTYDSYYRDYLHGHGFDDYDFWIASYSREPRFRHCVIWQFSQTGKAHGIGHAVDLNVFRGGDYSDFKEYVRRKGIQRTPRRARR